MNRMTTRQMRTAARKLGLALTTRDGGFMIVDPTNNTVVAGAHPAAYSMNADDVEAFLTEDNA